MAATRRAFVLCFFLALAGIVQADERILSFHSDIDIQRDGSMLVVETIRVVAQGQQIKRGIYRDFPTRYKDRFGNKYRVDFEVLHVERDGVPEPWHRKDHANGVRVYIGRSAHPIPPGTYTYVINYRTDRQFGFFESHDELYWNVTGNGWVFPIDSAAATVRLPEAVPPTEMALSAYTGAYGSSQQNYRGRLQSGAAFVEATEQLPPGSGMTLSLTWPKGVVQAPDAVQQAKYLLQDNRGLLLSLVALLGSLAYLGWAWSRYGRDPEAGVIFPHYEPPPGYSPASARYIRRMGYDTKTMSAALINLAVKGHVEIIQEGKDYELRRKPSDKPLAAGEKALLNRLFRSGTRVELEQGNHDLLTIAREAHKDALMRDYQGKYFTRNGIFLAPSLLASIVLFVIVIAIGEAAPLVIAAFVAVAVLHVLFAWLLKAPSMRGRLLLDKLEGFRLYLDVAEREDLELRNPPDRTPQLFETYLPFAIALDVEQSWARQFSDVFARAASGPGERYQPSWYQGRFDHQEVSTFCSDVGSGFASAISSAATPPGSGSGAGGGGFSGGGGGGGGGGGW